MGHPRWRSASTGASASSCGWGRCCSCSGLRWCRWPGCSSRGSPAPSWSGCHPAPEENVIIWDVITTIRTCQLVLIFVLLYFLCYCVVDEAHVSAPAQTLSSVSFTGCSVQCPVSVPASGAAHYSDEAGPVLCSRGQDCCDDTDDGDTHAYSPCQESMSVKETRPGIQQCQTQGQVFCPWLGSI